MKIVLIPNSYFWLKLISNSRHFNTNSTFVYSLFEPEKPGSIIQHLRLQLVTEMKKKGHKIPEISEVTGLSESYIRKLKV